MEGVFHKHEMEYKSRVYERSIQKQSLASGLEILTRILGIQREWIRFWLGGKKSKDTSTGSISTTIGNILLRFPS